MGLKLFFKKMNSLEVGPRVSMNDSWLKGFFFLLLLDSLFCFILFQLNMQKQGGSCGNSKRQLRGSYFSSLWGIFMINCWQRGLSPLRGMPSLGEWHWAVGKRKRSTQGGTRKQATFSQGLWCACLQPPTSHLTSHTDFPQQGTVMWKRKSNKPLPLQVDCDLYHIKGNLTRTVLGSRKGSSLTDMIMLTFFF